MSGDVNLKLGIITGARFAEDREGICADLRCAEFVSEI